MVASTSGFEPPLIYISYARPDEPWLEKILVFLKPMEAFNEIRVFYDRHLSPGDEWDETLRLNLEHTALGIVLLSPDWLANDYATTVEFPALASRKMIPVLVRECNWRDRPISRFQILTAKDRPLAEANPDSEERALHELVQAIRTQLGSPERISFSSEGQQLYALASRLARSRTEPGQIDAACVIYAFLERGRAEPTPIRTPQFLWNAIPGSGQSRYERLRQQHFPSFSSTQSTAVSDAVGPIVERASSLSIDTLKGRSIHARHLLAAALTDTGGPQVLTELDLDLESFKKSFLDFVFEVLPAEPKDPWKEFLALASDADQEPVRKPQPSRAGVPAEPGDVLIAAYQSEEWTGPDLLNTTRDVNALSALVAGWNVHPPLSIGLFGEWGSGKSFFMRQMRRRVNALALAAQASRKPQRECAYYKNIAQIEFNAWHYMEGDNLWACLVEHIFSNLGLPQDNAAAQVQARQKQILEQIGVKKTLEAEVAQAKAELEVKRTDAEQKARDARSQLDAAQTALERKKSALSKRITDKLSSEITSVIASIPEAVKLGDDVETARKLSEDASSVAGRIKLLWNLLRHDEQRRSILYWMLGGSAILFALGQIIHWLDPSLKLLIQQYVQVLLPIAGALAGTAVKFRPVLAKISHAVSVLEKKNQEITEVISAVEKQQGEEIAKLEGNIRSLSEQIDRASKEQEQNQRAIDKLEKELAETDASRLLSEFIRSRADADDYRKHLGMVALVRRDFERLSDFFRSQREDERSGKDRVDNNIVNRIVLYIDDLDRCPPETVVKTLQAIHLLLAFPIFVVVVAVDARWVSRSLEQCYDWLVPEIQPSVQPHISTGIAERVRSASSATAHDYIEKIFQIPFWLAPMTSQTCQSMIHGLTAAIALEQSTLKQSIAAAEQQLAAKPAAATAATVGVSASPSSQPVAVTSSPPAPALSHPLIAVPAGATPIDHGADEIDLNPRQLDIEEVEMKKIDELAVLIGRSPRVAKRFLNCYRLIKARMTEAERSKFLEGSFKNVMEILAIIVGAPSISRALVETLSVENSVRDGGAFLAELAKRLSANALATSDGVEVARLLSTATSEHLKSLRAVAPLVSRFSFATQGEKSSAAGKVPRRKPKSVTA